MQAKGIFVSGWLTHPERIYSGNKKKREYNAFKGFYF